MRTLTKEEKADLELLMNHKGFKLLENLVGEFENDVLKSLKTINLADDKQLRILNAKQNYLKWVEDFLSTMKNKTNSIGKREF